MNASTRFGVGIVILAGTLLRLPGLSAPPLAFHPVRQYFGATDVLRFYAENGDGQRAEIGARPIVSEQAQDDR